MSTEVSRQSQAEIQVSWGGSTNQSLLNGGLQKRGLPLSQGWARWLIEFGKEDVGFIFLLKLPLNFLFLIYIIYYYYNILLALLPIFYHLANPVLGLLYWPSEWSSPSSVGPSTLLRVVDLRTCCFLIQNPPVSHRVKTKVIERPTGPLHSAPALTCPAVPPPVSPWLPGPSALASSLPWTCQVPSCLRPLAVPLREAPPQTATWSAPPLSGLHSGPSQWVLLWPHYLKCPLYIFCSLFFILFSIVHIPYTIFLIFF